jgi:glycosyltransferase involved in cell wall biosynthesis
MKAIILTPTFFPRLTGNAVTAGRIAQELTEGGIECRVIDLSVVGAAEAEKATREFGPDLVHGFHAYKSGRIGLAIKELLEIPMIMTLTGTDLHSDLKTQEKREAVLRVLAKSDRMTVFNDSARRLLIREGIAPQKITVIHQSVFFPEREERDFRSELHIGRRTKVCLLMGGIRRIKNLGYAFPVLEKVRKSFPDLCLLVAGGVLEEEEFRRLTRKSRGRPWIRFLGEVSRKEIPSLLSCADIVLNTSDSESEANAVVEALAFGKVVVGRHISGNSSLLADKTGFLFRNREELHEQILRILRNRKEATETGRRAKRFIAARFQRDREQVDYLRLYRETADQRFGRSSRSMNHSISYSGTTSIGPGSGKTRSTSE